MSEEPAVKITLSDVYDEVKGLRSDMTPVPVLVRRQEDQEARIRKLEAWKYALPASLVTAVGAVVLAFV